MTDEFDDAERLRVLAGRIENLANAFKEKAESGNELTEEQLAKMETLSDEFTKSVADLSVTVEALTEFYKESE